MSWQCTILVAFVTFTLFFELVRCSIVTTLDGRIQGTTMQTRRGVIFDAFLGIPFAKAPILERRFKDPIPNDPWTGILDGTKYGPACPQPAGLIPSANISEDCLHLNIFTKCLPGNGSDPKPVIVYIHGGGFLFGSAIISTPVVMMDRDIVFVTINYRMAAFGFLATGSKEAPGNAGMKDQVMAMKWIKCNIAAFGGNAEKITIWGLSAGSISATSHMVSPLSSGLFHRVIAMSGSITSHKHLSYDQMSSVKTLALATNCDNNDPDEIVRCLRNCTVEEIASVAIYWKDKLQPCPVFVWWPVVEKDFGQDRFLEEQPNELFERGEFARVPSMIGTVTDEFASIAPGVLGSSVLVKELNENFESVGPKCFIFDENRKMSDVLRETYFPYEVIDRRSFEDIGHLFSDSILGFPIHLFVNLTSKFIDVFYYKFSFSGSFSVFNYPSIYPYSVSHSDDSHYLVPYEHIPMIGIHNADNFIVERLLSIYENFARNGNPNNLTDVNLGTMKWPVFDEVNAYYLDFGKNFVQKNGLYLNRFARWTNAKRASRCT